MSAADSSQSSQPEPNNATTEHNHDDNMNAPNQILFQMLKQPHKAVPASPSPKSIDMDKIESKAKNTSYIQLNTNPFPLLYSTEEVRVFKARLGKTCSWRCIDYQSINNMQSKPQIPIYVVKLVNEKDCPFAAVVIRLAPVITRKLRDKLS
ncbi:hypothetical protein DPMN_153867 [Dreissena polymorpha]|uniref:Uncharacterized protein n=1 Tax=Dreissena polymorpha TaxID=45954 RepID=A0A9D4FLJ8_DREPO|nr:hypothetical protein DPMN_153867 [Dreissena polymorpha]